MTTRHMMTDARRARYDEIGRVNAAIAILLKPYLSQPRHTWPTYHMLEQQVRRHKTVKEATP